jgi:hypothetical protein
VRRWRGWIGYAGLLAIVTATALAVRADDAASSPEPSIENPASAGLGVLYTYLLETGSSVSALRAPFTQIPPDARVLVTAGSATRSDTGEEVEALQAFVEGGGTLVYLAPHREAGGRGRLVRWLQLEDAPVVETARVSAGLADPLGVSVDVWRAFGPLAGLHQLRLSRTSGFALAADGAVPVAGLEGQAAVWWRQLGAGEIWIARVDLGENRRIDLDDNLAFWTQLAARGPMVFDEWHRQAGPLPPVSRGLWAIAIQAVVCTGAFAYARGVRLGPARPTPVERHRSTLEYLRSFAWLTRRARVERELVEELHHRLRALLRERAGVPVTLPDAEIPRLLEERWHVPASDSHALLEDVHHVRLQGEVRPADYARLARACARLEHRLVGNPI